MTCRIALGISYTGTQYKGWQYQPGLPTLQGFVEAALSEIAKHPIQVTCAGRTDFGVHAFGQIVHFDTGVSRPLEAWTRGTNTYLPSDIRVHWAKEVPSDFNARRSAVKRRYGYVILNAPIAPAVLRNHVTWVYTALDVNKMQTASQALLGEHDFSAFRGKHCQAKSPIRHLSHISCQRQGHYLLLTVEANAFLHHMVRNIAGVLMAIGQGKEPIDWAQHVLASKSRCEAGITAPSQGLYLEKVHYPEKFDLPNFTEVPWYT